MKSVGISLMGGLGNQLFQLSCAWAYAKRHNLELYIPDTIINPHYPGQKPYPFPGIKYRNDKPEGLTSIYTEPYFHYREIPEVECDHLQLTGYFQSFKYFEEYRVELLEALGFTWNMEKGWCSIHVRRGDYMEKEDYHPFVGGDYFIRAMAEMKNRTGITRFRIFSNDLPWCVPFFEQFKQYQFDYWIGGSEMDDLQKGACCQHLIGSNSTYSLWMYYLNQNPYKIGIFPRRWFGKLADHNTDDLYPQENCIIL